jgi:hypothetical protein
LKIVIAFYFGRDKLAPSQRTRKPFYRVKNDKPLITFLSLYRIESRKALRLVRDFSSYLMQALFWPKYTSFVIGYNDLSMRETLIKQELTTRKAS